MSHDPLSSHRLYHMTYQVVIDYVDVLQLYISAKDLLQVLLRRVEAETKHTQHIGRIRIELGEERRKGERRGTNKLSISTPAVLNQMMTGTHSVSLVSPPGGHWRA